MVATRVAKAAVRPAAKGAAGTARRFTRVTSSPVTRAGLYGVDAYFAHRDFRVARKDGYGKRSAFAQAAAYSVPGIAATYATRNKSLLKVGIPVGIAAGAGGMLVSHQIKKHTKHVPKYQKRARVKRRR